MPADKIPAKPGKDTIYIDVDDEITSIIDKAEGAKSKVVALVLPKRATALQSIVNMRLLRRAADNAGKNVVLITTETALLPLAGAARLHVAKTLQSKPEIPPAPGMLAEPSISAGTIKDAEDIPDAQEVADNEEPENLPSKINYEKSIGELAAVHEVEHPETIEIGDEDAVNEAAKSTEKLPKAPKNKALKVPNFDKFRLFLFLGIGGFIALIVFIILAVFVLPKATIAIDTTSTPVSANLTLTTSDKATSYDDTKKIIPAVLKTSDQTQSQSVQATGQQNTGDKATGTMVFYNCNQSDTLAGTNRTVPAGTGVSANGLTYITQQSATVPPSHFIGGVCQNDMGSNSVDIKAQTGGAKYNQDATTYSVAGYSSISGKGSKTTGGTDNIQTVVSQADLDNARQKVTSASSDTFSKNFLKTLGDQGLYALTSTLKINDPATTASPDVGQLASNVNVTVKITYTVLTVKKADLITAINSALGDQVDESKQKIEETDLLNGASVSIANQSSPTVATLNITEDASAVPIINTAAIKKQVAGKKTGDITNSLSTIPGVKSVKVKLSPFWVSKVPKDTGKITVTLRHITESK